MTRYRWVAARKAEGFPATASCDVAGVSRRAFCDWAVRRAAGPSPAEAAEAGLVGAVTQIHADSGGACGSPGVAAQLRRQGRRVNRERVERLMRLHGICGIRKQRKPRWRRSSGVEQAPADLARRHLVAHAGRLAELGVEQAPGDLVRRRFRPGRPDVVWAGDIACIPADRGWLHLAAVPDVGPRRLIGYSMAHHTRAELVVDALHTAASARGHRTAGVVFHSDRGSQHLSAEHASALARHKMRQSVGRVGNCWDNSVVESFFSSLKRELVSQHRFETPAQARRAVFTWTGRYNTQRIHSTPDYLTPTEREDHYRQRLEQAA